MLNTWLRKMFSKHFSHLVTLPRYCSSLKPLFHFAIILLSWMKRWMKTCSYPYARTRPISLSLLPTGVFLCPQHLAEPKVACVAVWLEAAPSTWTSTWFLNGLQGGWKIGWTVRMKSCDQQLKVQELSLRDQWQGQNSLISSINDLDNGTKCAPSSLTDVTKQESRQ